MSFSGSATNNRMCNFSNHTFKAVFKVNDKQAWTYIPPWETNLFLSRVILNSPCQWTLCRLHLFVGLKTNTMYVSRLCENQGSPLCLAEKSSYDTKWKAQKYIRQNCVWALHEQSLAVSFINSQYLLVLYLLNNKWCSLPPHPPSSKTNTNLVALFSALLSDSALYVISGPRLDSDALLPVAVGHPSSSTWRWRLPVLAPHQPPAEPLWWSQPGDPVLCPSKRPCERCVSPAGLPHSGRIDLNRKNKTNIDLKRYTQFKHSYSSIMCYKNWNPCVIKSSWTHHPWCWEAVLRWAGLS